MPEERIRPSLLSSAGPSLVTTAFFFAKQANFEKALIQGLERGVQDENDEQLRMLNEKQITDPTLRK